MPASCASDLIEFDGSVILDRTSGELTPDATTKYTEKLLFAPATDEAADPDDANIGPEMAQQMKEKMKYLFRAGKTPK